MKTLSLVLLLALTAEAQRLADVARMERERRARLNSTRVIVAEGSPVPAPAPTPANPADAPSPQTSGKEAAAPAATAPAAPAPTPQPAVDPLKQWNEEVEALRTRIQGLQDTETALQLQISQLTNQFFAPVTDQNSRNQVQARLGETQSKLSAVQVELEQAKKTLEEMILQGPPKK